MRYDIEFTNASGSESFTTLSEAAANDEMTISVRIRRHDTDSAAIYTTSYDEAMWSAIEMVISMYGESYEEGDMETPDLHEEMEHVIEAHIGAIMRDDPDSMMWEPLQD